MVWDLHYSTGNCCPPVIKFGISWGFVLVLKVTAPRNTRHVQQMRPA